MNELVKQKKIMRLTEDHINENTSLYPDENGFYLEGSEGVVIDEHTIGLIPNLSEKEYSIVLSREIMAKERGAFLMLIDGHLVTISSTKLEVVRYEPSLPIFEDEEDREQYIDEMLDEIKNAGGENAST